MSLRHSVPAEFTDEDRWLKYFTKKTLGFLMAGLLITFMLFKLLAIVGGAIIGVVLGLAITAALVFIAAFPIPESMYIKGANLTLDVILARRLIRAKNKVIYVKGYDGGKGNR